MIELLKQRQTQRRIGQTEVIETPPLYLPWSQRILNPFPLASSGGNWGDMGQPWPVNVLAFYCSVFVLTTNNATNFWTVQLKSNAGTILAAFVTSGIAANTETRFAPGVTAQPATTAPFLTIVATATLNPGAIFIWPAVALLRTG